MVKNLAGSASGIFTLSGDIVGVVFNISDINTCAIQLLLVRGIGDNKSRNHPCSHVRESSEEGPHFSL